MVPQRRERRIGIDRIEVESGLRIEVERPEEPESLGVSELELLECKLGFIGQRMRSRAQVSEHRQSWSAGSIEKISDALHELRSRLVVARCRASLGEIEGRKDVSR